MNGPNLKVYQASALPSEIEAVQKFTVGSKETGVPTLLGDQLKEPFACKGHACSSSFRSIALVHEAWVISARGFKVWFKCS